MVEKIGPELEISANMGVTNVIYVLNYGALPHGGAHH
jgi:hypothetical protein